MISGVFISGNKDTREEKSNESMQQNTINIFNKPWCTFNIQIAISIITLHHH